MIERQTAVTASIGRPAVPSTVAFAESPSTTGWQATQAAKRLGRTVTAAA